MKIKGTLIGDKQIEVKMNASGLGILAASRLAVLHEAQDIMSESLEEVPKDTEALAKSAYLEQEANGSVTFGYGGPNVQINPKNGQRTDEYMLSVHENLQAQHPVGKAKFLEGPLNRHRDVIEDTLANKIRNIIGW
jgi:hypothetical protein